MRLNPMKLKMILVLTVAILSGQAGIAASGGDDDSSIDGLKKLYPFFLKAAQNNEACSGWSYFRSWMDDPYNIADYKRARCLYKDWDDNQSGIQDQCDEHQKCFMNGILGGKHAAHTTMTLAGMRNIEEEKTFRKLTPPPVEGEAWELKFGAHQDSKAYLVDCYRSAWEKSLAELDLDSCLWDGQIPTLVFKFFSGFSVRKVSYNYALSGDEWSMAD